MGGTLIIDDKEAWMPAGWVFDAVLEDIGKALPPQTDELRAMLDEAVRGFNYCDLRKLDGAQFRQFLAGADRVYEETVAKGAAAFADPTFYPGYVKQFDELRAKLSADPRAKEVEP